MYLVSVQGKSSNLEFPMSHLLVGNPNQLTWDMCQAAAYLISGQIPEALALFSKMWNVFVEGQGCSGDTRTLIGDKIALCYATEKCNRIYFKKSRAKSYLDIEV